MLTPEQKADVMRFVTKCIHDIFKYQEAVEAQQAEIRQLRQDINVMKRFIFVQYNGGQGIQQPGHH